MDINNNLIFSALIYKLICLAVGGLSIYLGYKLFSKGIWGQSGDLQAKFNNTQLVLKNGAPGTFFAVLGAVIICATIVIGFKAKNEVFADGTMNETLTQSQQVIPNDKPPLE